MESLAGLGALGIICQCNFRLRLDTAFDTATVGGSLYQHAERADSNNNHRAQNHRYENSAIKSNNNNNNK